MAILKGKDTISGALGRCFVTLNGNRYELLQLKNVKAKVEKTKTEIKVLGSVSAANKATGLKYTGSATLYYTTSLFRELMERYKTTGEDIYFDMQIENEDPTSNIGKQVVLLLNCNINNLTIAQLDVTSEALEDEFDFTFEDWKLPVKFNVLDGMAQ